MFKKSMYFYLALLASVLIMVGNDPATAKDSTTTSTGSNGDPELEEIAYEAFIYAYPLLEQVKTVNGMMGYMGLEPNKVVMSTRLPRENIGQPIVAPNLTSMTGGMYIDISHGPVTIEIPEVNDRYITYQAIDVFTHNFYYMGTRANGGEGGRFVFHNQSQSPTDAAAKHVEVEGDHAIIIVRIDIKDDSEYKRVRAIQDAIRIVDAPQGSRDYPAYSEDKAFSPAFVEYLNALLTDVPESETALFERFARIGVMNVVDLSNAGSAAVQRGIDRAYTDIKAATSDLHVGNGYIATTEIFGTRQFLAGDYLGRAVGAHFGLWGNSREEANYYLTYVEGDGQVVFEKDDLPPLTEIGFWSVTVHDEDVRVQPNDFGSYVLTADRMVFEGDGSLVIRFSSEPEEGSWLYTPGGKMVILIRAYQADPDKIGSYVPPAFEPAHISE